MARFDGVVAQRLLDIAASKNIRYVIGDRVSEGPKRPANVNVMTLTDLSSFDLLERAVRKVGSGACTPTCYPLDVQFAVNDDLFSVNLDRGLGEGLCIAECCIV